MPSGDPTLRPSRPLGGGAQSSHLTVRKVLRRHNLPPAPRRGQRSWREFIRQHADQMLASDFFCVDTVWMTRLYVLFFTATRGRALSRQQRFERVGGEKRGSDQGFCALDPTGIVSAGTKYSSADRLATDL